MAKPDAAGVGMVAGWMKDVFVEGADVERDGESFDAEDSRVGMDEAFGQDGDQIGLRDHVQGLQIVGNG